MLGLGTSIGGHVTAPILVVNNFAQLNSSAAKGKIVVYNYFCDWKAGADKCYGEMATYRVDGASAASRVGALASLTRSLTGKSLYTPHTGFLSFFCCFFLIAVVQLRCAALRSDGDAYSDGLHYNRRR